MYSECQEACEKSCQTEFVDGENDRPGKTTGQQNQGVFDFRKGEQEGSPRNFQGRDDMTGEEGMMHGCHGMGGEW